MAQARQTKPKQAKPAKPTPAEVKQALARLRAAIEKFGVLLQHDPRRRSATALIAGAPVPGTWWAHARGALIYEVLCALDDDEVAYPKLLGGKVTLVHRRLWPALAAVARAGAAWQQRGLKPDARALLERISSEAPRDPRRGRRVLRTDTLPLPPGSRKVGIITRELEARLLVYSEGEHTEGGHHARTLFPFAAWQKKKRLSNRDLPSTNEAYEALTAAALHSLGESESHGLLPWSEQPGRAAAKRR